MMIRRCNSFLPQCVSSAALSTFQYRMLLFRRTLIMETVQQPVKLERLSDSDSGIVELKLERAEVKNAIGKEMLKGLQNALHLISEDKTVNVLVLSSSVPGIFCAGADLKERKKMNVSEVQLFVNSLRSTFSSLERLPVPTIAAIDGAALGGGMEMALSCDLRVCGEGSTFSLPETGLAIIPGAGGTQRLPRIVGQSKAKELIFTGRRINGQEALSMGLANFCVPSGEAYLKALQIAQDINKKVDL